MDFTDITFTIPMANIFSGIEPCLAVVLASVPMMRPLLGRSAATPYGSGQKAANTESISAGQKGVGEDGFERLHDDTSNLWLRPMGLQHRADASALRETVVGDDSEEDERTIHGQDTGGGSGDAGIRVDKTFQVSRRVGR